MTLHDRWDGVRGSSSERRRIEHCPERRWRSRPVSRILCRDRGPGGGHLSRRARGSPRRAAASRFTRAVRPTRQLGRATLERCLLDLAPGGACRAGAVARAAGALLPHRFTLAPPKRGGLFSVAPSRGRPRLGHPSTLPCGVRTFLDRARGAAAAARPAPPITGYCVRWSLLDAPDRSLPRDRRRGRGRLLSDA
jgi:hypothetical protein